MSKVIIYQQEGLPVSVVWPVECGIPLDKIAQKDVPDGVPYWIVLSSDLPGDRTFREAWELDVPAMGEPDGAGDTSAFIAWEAEELERILEDLKGIEQ